MFGAVLAPALATPAGPASILFIGNSFTYAHGSPVRYYRADAVTDLNGTGVGGVPALFESFASQAGVPYSVYLETEPGVGLDWHLARRREVIGARAWDVVVMHGYSTLDQQHPGDPTLLTHTVHDLAALLRTRNGAVDIRLMATWPRADQLYEIHGPWFGKTAEVMAHDIRVGYNLAAAGVASVRGIVPVGEAWVRAMRTGVADPNPYDGLSPGMVDLWSYDHYHASTPGYYLEALLVFGSVTGRDPRSLGTSECSAFELGLPRTQVGALQQVAYDELTAQGIVLTGSPASAGERAEPPRCERPRAH